MTASTNLKRIRKLKKLRMPDKGELLTLKVALPRRASQGNEALRKLSEMMKHLL